MRRVLFITSNRLGDAILSTGLLDHLLRTEPHARFTVVCGEVAADLFTRMPRRDQTIVLEKRSWARHWPPLWRKTVGTRWDLVVDIRGSALSWMVFTRRRAIMRRRPGLKIAQLAAVLGVQPPPLPVAWTAPQDQARAAAMLPTGRILALAPTANWLPKVWPADRFVGLVRQFPGMTPVVFGGPGPTERSLVTPVLAQLPQAIDLVGRLSLPEVAACLSRATLFVGNDSGLMHLAAAAGAPTLGLFGPTDATTYAPAGPRGQAVVAGSMTALSLATVVDAARGLMQRVSPPAAAAAPPASATESR